VLVAAITVVGLALRLALADQGPFGDELFTYDETRGSLADVFDGMERNEVNPPLYYLLAWASQQLGSSASWLRLPSLVAGTAVIPLVYVLGRRASGSAAGLLASALVALSPFALFYSTEARAYSLAMMLSAASALLLLRALERRSAASWAAYGVVVCAAMYTHYTLVFVLGVQAVWALWTRRELWRELLAVYAVAAVAYIPWVPSLMAQRDEPLKLAVVGGGADVTLGNLLDHVSRLVPGHLFVPLDELPGLVPIVLLAAALGVALAWALVRFAGAPRAPDLASPTTLVVLLAFATPVGVFLYSTFGTNLLNARNLSGSLPFLVVALGALAASLRPRVMAVVAVVALGAMSVGVVRSFDEDYERPDFRRVGAYLDSVAGPKDPVVGTLPTSGPFSLSVFLRRPHPLFAINGDDGPAWAAARRGGSTYLVLQLGSFFNAPSPYGGPTGRLILREQKRFPGLGAAAVARYSGEIDARLDDQGGPTRIVLSEGSPITVRPGVARGYVERLKAEGGNLTAEGWAAAGTRAVDWVVVFAGTRLVAGAVPVYPRADVGTIDSGPVAAAGFLASGPQPRAARAIAGGRVRVFAVIGKGASELPRLEE
jgi:hypothetical protein